MARRKKGAKKKGAKPKKSSRTSGTKSKKKKGRASTKKTPAPKATRAKATSAKAATKKASSKMDRYGKVLKTFKDRKILVIGDLMLDKYIWGDVERISPEAPVPVVKVVGETFGLGGSANVAANIRDLDAKVVPLGVVGNDQEGEWLLKELKERGMPSGYIIKHPTRRTTSKTRVMARNQQVVRIDKEITDTISSTLENALGGYLHSLMDEIDGIVVSDYGKGVVTPGLVRRVVQEGRAKRKLVFVDPKLPNYREYMGCTAITPNHYEAASFVGSVPNRQDRLIGIGKDIIRTLKLEALLITRGKDGMSLFLESGRVHHIPTVAREVFDVTGAGDTVMSAFALAACSGANWLEAAVIANYAAGVVIGKLGAATVTLDELSKEMARE